MSAGPGSVADGDIPSGPEYVWPDLDVTSVLCLLSWTEPDDCDGHITSGNNTEDNWNTAMNTSQVQRVLEY